MKLACVLIPSLPVQVEQQRRGILASLIISHPVDRATVFAMSGDVAEAGVQMGMSLYQARQVAPAALVVEPDEPAYHALHDAVYAALHGLSPLAEAVGLGELLVDARGLEGYLGEQAIAKALCALARSASGLSVRVGIAANRFTAEQAARRAEADGVIVVPPGEEARFLAPLSIDILPHLTGEMRRRLSLLDAHTLGDLAALPESDVLRQFGPEMAYLHELARGEDPRPLDPDAPPLRLVRTLKLKGAATERKALLAAADRLCSQLSKDLIRRGCPAEALKLRLYTHDGSALEAGQALRPPASSEARLARAAAQLLGRLRVTAPVVLVAVSVYPRRTQNLGANHLAEVGAGAVHFRPGEDRHAERSEASRSEASLSMRQLADSIGKALVRVAVVLGPPVPVRARVSLDASGLPARLEFGGQTRIVVGVDDQWREERDWWASRQSIRRDYFRVVLADGTSRNIFQKLCVEPAEATTRASVSERTAMGASPNGESDGEWFLDRAWPLL